MSANIVVNSMYIIMIVVSVERSQVTFFDILVPIHYASRHFIILPKGHCFVKLPLLPRLAEKTTSRTEVYLILKYNFHVRLD